MSYTQTIYHIVIRTKHSKPTITQERASLLYNYIWGVIRNKNGVLYRINGIADHIHIVSSIHPSIALSDFVKDIKVSTSLWMKSSNQFPYFEGWGEGYCGLTCSYGEKDKLINYVKSQQQHHKKETFEEELIRIFKEMNIEIDNYFLT